ncbi:hypothetical protein GCM10011344_41110 [Dokdonia pacifica]|uniref:DnaA protein helix-turn-helix n=1 Tax=Dokdonia pacifica TaxID=1627892 RepID=A0A239ABD9_9FLAO|nr:hypothetical protein [Dokdonia pacifica]GGG35978.1 hypothetical protein GCM10011344_41110 [Dokdonia pacifica]SNR92859.1 hypothetical protein SAMN06265376_104297 [Dokdonia pacifica]
MEEKQLLTKELDAEILQLIAKFGFERAIKVMQSMTCSDRIITNTHKVDLVVHFLKIKATEVFDVPISTLLTATDESSKQARMCSYYLLITYLDMSYRSVGKYYKKSNRSTRYNYKKLEEILSIKSYYKELYERFVVLERLFINYLIQLNMK